MSTSSNVTGSVLIALDGPMHGQWIELGSSDVTLGREEGNSHKLEDQATSRRHCIIRAMQDHFLITDLDSRNGTFVNGLPIRERQLQHNDQVRVGDSVFLFQHKIPVTPTHAPVEVDSSVATNADTHWKSDASLYLDKERLASALPDGNRVARGLQVLLRISGALQGAQTLDALERDLLEILFEAVPASIGAICLGSAPGSLDSTFAVHRAKNRHDPVHVPSEILQQVLSARVGVLSTRELDTVGGGRPLLAVPLLCFDQIEGLLYLEADAGMVLDREHLELASGVGAIAGLAIHNLLRWESLRSENERLQAAMHAEHDMIGGSDAMTKVHRFITQVAGTDSTVLIGGESGTGKELVARALHRNSPRMAKPFVAINCAALTESLLEDELFGHERGAFTGAVALKKGKFEVADGGTLFLDEVGELAPGLQAKLLRALQQREFERVGGTRPIHVDVRIIAATNRNLEAAAKENQFRSDLFFRLNVIAIDLPPLRNRRDDIPLLASHFMRRFSQRTKRQLTGVSKAAEAALKKYDWPGNVRELENAIERAVVMGTSDVLLPEDLPDSVLETATAAGLFSASDPQTAAEYQNAVTEAKRRAVRDALDRAGGVFTEAAKILGVHPNYLHRLVNNLGLR